MVFNGSIKDFHSFGRGSNPLGCFPRGRNPSSCWRFRDILRERVNSARARWLATHQSLVLPCGEMASRSALDREFLVQV